ncbi:unnamed protein product [Rhodiola kirilowii]
MMMMTVICGMLRDLDDLRRSSSILATTSMGRCLASTSGGRPDFATRYLLILDRINWKTNILTGLLIPYIFFSLPSLVFNIFRSLSNQEISNGVG